MAAPSLVAPAPTAVDALNQLNQIVTRYCESQMFFAACELGLFEQLAHGRASHTQLADRLKLHPDACHSLLTGLAQMDLVREHADAFANTEVALYLTSAAPVPLDPLAMWGNLFAPMWGHLSDAVRENSPRWQQTFGATQQDVFANLYKDPASLSRFTSLMSAYSIPQGKLVAETFDFSPYNCILDVAGGPGGLVIEVGKKYPQIHGIVMDLPPVCALADKAIEAASLADRYESQFADLFEGPYPTGADVVSLAWVLHDWNDEHCRAILHHCHDALPIGGKLLITESVLDHDRSGTPFAVLMSLHMLLCCEPGAKERTMAEYETLLHETGFRIDKLVRLEAPRDLLIATRV